MNVLLVREGTPFLTFSCRQSSRCRANSSRGVVGVTRPRRMGHKMCEITVYVVRLYCHHSCTMVLLSPHVYQSAKSVRSHLEYLCHKNMAKCDNCSTAHAQRMAFQGLMQLDPQQCTSCCVQSHNANREHKTRKSFIGPMIYAMPVLKPRGHFWHAYSSLHSHFTVPKWVPLDHLSTYLQVRHLL